MIIGRDVLSSYDAPILISEARKNVATPPFDPPPKKDMSRRERSEPCPRDLRAVTTYIHAHATPPTESRLATYEKWMKVGLVSANFFTRTERRLIVEREFGVCISGPRNGKGLVRGGADTRATARGS